MLGCRCGDRVTEGEGGGREGGGGAELMMSLHAPSVFPACQNTISSSLFLYDPSVCLSPSYLPPSAPPLLSFSFPCFPLLLSFTYQCCASPPRLRGSSTDRLSHSYSNAPPVGDKQAVVSHPYHVNFNSPFYVQGINSPAAS